jgi:uncharacterized membrane protein YoaT (DUF817 family)
VSGGPIRLPLERWGRAVLARLERRARRSRAGRFGFEFLMFGLKQGWACLFGGAMLTLIFLSARFYPVHAPLARYDFLVLAAVAIQIAMLAFKLESLDEAKVILAFHVAGTAMEIFKTSAGSWIYPEASILRIGAVPLFSGFMYGSVGSYIARSWRILDFRFGHYPPRVATWALAGAIYVNFFSHHWLPDIRLALFVATAFLFWRCRVFFKPDRTVRAMPMLLGFFLVACFIWLAENIGTFSHAWMYPSQHSGWSIVSPEKLGSWFLLMIVSFVLVSLLHQRKEFNDVETDAHDTSAAPNL